MGERLQPFDRKSSIVTRRSFVITVEDIMVINSRHDRDDDGDDDEDNQPSTQVHQLLWVDALELRSKYVEASESSKKLSSVIRLLQC